MIITNPPEDFRETILFKKLVAKSKSQDGLADKVDAFIKSVRPMQELIIGGPFSDYTLHNPNHSKKVMHIAGFVISESTLSKLSTLEIAILIMSFYLHDLGMNLTDIERKRLITSREFNKYIETRSEYKERLEVVREKLKNAYKEEKINLETTLFQINESALAEYLRPLHAKEETYNSLIETIVENSGRSDLFAIDQISFQEELVNLCVSHNLSPNLLVQTTGLYKDRFPTEKIINGFELNIQYCAAVLRLSDILDFDRERTPISIFNAIGIQSKMLPGFEISLKEWNKHLAVHSIAIKENEILISGDSNHPNIEHSVLEFSNIIESEIRNTLAVIRRNPERIIKKYNINLPQIVRPDIRSQGYIYKNYSISLNESAIVNLLMGDNLYRDSSVALRELIQNSIDACSVKKNISNEDYSPKIIVEDYIDEDSRRWLKVTDNGIGMDEFVLSNYFFKIGNTYYKSNDFKSLMKQHTDEPFVPISRYGIGILSVFMIGEMIKVITRNSDSPRKDYKERTLLIDGVNSLAVVTENDGTKNGTEIHVLLRKGKDNDQSIRKLFGFVKENIIRPHIPIELIETTTKSIHLKPNNFSKINPEMIPVLEKNNIEFVQIDFSRFSNLIKGKGYFFFFKEEEGKLCYYDKNLKLEWDKYPLKESILFKSLGGSRITINGILMRLRKIGSLYNLKKKVTACIFDIEVKGLKRIRYDVSRDRIFGNGVHIIRAEIYKSITLGLKQIGIYERLNDETKTMLEIVKHRKLPSEPLKQDLIDKIKDLLPNKGKWPTAIHKEIAIKLDESNKTIEKYITAMLHLKVIKKP